MGDNLGKIIDLAASMGTILGLAFYVAIVIWTYKDARKRTDDPIMVATFTAIAMLPVFGVLIYLLVRPSEYLADVRERELEIRALERQLGRQERCPYCKSHIEGDYLSCPVCTTKLRQSCTGCERPLDPRWVLCPFCETEVPRSEASPRGPRPGASSSAPSRRPMPASAPRESSRESRRTSSDARSTASAAASATAKPSVAKAGATTPAASTSSGESSSETRAIRTEPLDASESSDPTRI